MPKTRNVSRTQWDAANATNATSAGTAGRNRSDHKENGRKADKENGPVATGRATCSQSTRSAAGILGTLGSATGNPALGPLKGGKLSGDTLTAKKGKGKPTGAPLKRKKVPLQDITHQFLPAPEPFNRGEEHQNLTEEDLSAAHAEPANIISAMAPAEATPVRMPPLKFTSPLPPSSPPSPFVSSPIIASHKELPHGYTARSGTPAHSLPQQAFDPWDEFDEAHPIRNDSPDPAKSNSDPFGFVALERKLKAEREAAVEETGDGDAEYDEFALLPVADTSSPRPVRRLKRALPGTTKGVDNLSDLSSNSPNVHVQEPAAAPYTIPLTPHKDKQKRRRHSLEGPADIFSPAESSIESSPSPTKASARKRIHSQTYEDPLDQFNQEVEHSRDGIDIDEPLGKRPRQDASAADVDVDVPSKNLRKRASRVAVDVPAIGEEDFEVPAVKVKAHKKPVSKVRAVAKDEVKANAEDEDLELKWQRERQERVEYFKHLDDYEVEQEDVYLV